MSRSRPVAILCSSEGIDLNIPLGESLTCPAVAHGGWTAFGRGHREAKAPAPPPGHRTRWLGWSRRGPTRSTGTETAVRGGG
jgi:hypothetical protein